MTLHDHLVTMAKYHYWAYTELFKSTDALSKEEYTKNIGLFFKSVHGTLNHLCLVDRLWYGRYIETPIQVTGLDQELFSDYDSLKKSLLLQAQHWIEFVSNINAAQIDSTLNYKNIKGLSKSMPYTLCAFHVFNHGTHHRGQITAALTQLQKPSPEIDLLDYLMGDKR